MVSVLLIAVGIGPGVANRARALPLSFAGPAPATIPYAGHLSDETGKPVADGAYDFTFTLYDTVAGGEPLWSEMQWGVVVSKGEFLTTLGSVEPIPARALSGQSRWLAVTVRGPGEADFTGLTPRQRVSVAAPTVSARPAADAACPHDHFGEHWSGDSGPLGNGLRVENTYLDGIGVTGAAHNGSNTMGVLGWSEPGTGVKGSSSSGTGVHGVGADGVVGESSSAGGYGVIGRSGYTGVYGFGQIGLFGERPSDCVGECYAGFFSGDVLVVGQVYKSGGGFKIDHPLDPANKYLYHSFVESPDMKNLYDGVATLDAKGEAVVELPAWFGALNRDSRYQLTCIGGFAPVYIADEIGENQFKIAGGKPGLKVSWQVTGIRQDPYAEQHRIPVEEDKSPEERGGYIYPEGYGLPDTMRLNVQHQQFEEAQR
jgi:hypothetical protein